MARMRATQIDRELAAGSASDRELAAGSTSLPAQILAVRAQRITGSRSRRSLAAGLARVLKAAADSGANLTAAIGPDRHEVLAGRIVLGALERRLQAPEPVRAQGVAMLRLLLIEPDSPLYRPGEVGALGSRLRAAAAELEPGGGAR
jgi:hypothetical protein